MAATPIDLDDALTIQKNKGMVPRCIILLTAAAAIWLNGFAPLATADHGGGGSSSQSPCQVMPATPPTAGAAIGAKSFGLMARPDEAAEIVRQPTFVLPEPAERPRLPRTLLAQHILLRI